MLKIANLIPLLALSFVVAGVATPAHALPLPKTQLKAAALPKTLTKDYDFTGIVALDNCSGSIVRFENSKDTDHAMVMTNGHCIETGLQDPNTYVYNKPSSRSFTLLDTSGSELGELSGSDILYSSMTKTDVTFYRLVETYAEIQNKFHTPAFTLASTHPVANTAIEVISGYWQRGYTCAIETFIPTLREGDWSWTDSIRYSRPGCEVIGGTSGSPIIAKGTKTVIGINNTTNENGEQCTFDNPCEVDASGEVTFTKGYSYGQETFWVYTCLNAKNDIDLSVAGCQLFHGN